ncbi:hypothetical protein QBC35DRAFT_458853 [Podospora australis]|uniref:Uncharacterized protein n=1 Tax=Podospora australis TaxID=1536484 RepID=A0AAN6X3U6_9PEZI|nr:hypothetical protein QBC35DRAFT_458853 [Podospora australis]
MRRNRRRPSAEKVRYPRKRLRLSSEEDSDLDEENPLTLESTPDSIRSRLSEEDSDHDEESSVTLEDIQPRKIMRLPTRGSHSNAAPSLTLESIRDGQRMRISLPANCPKFTARESFCELVQNWRRAILRSYQISENQLQFACDDFSRNGTVTDITYTAVASIQHAGDDQLIKEAVGYIRFKSLQCLGGKGFVEIVNRTARMDPSHLENGDKPMNNNQRQAGDHGAGLKAALLGLICRDRKFNVRCVSDACNWTFASPTRGTLVVQIRRMTGTQKSDDLFMSRVELDASRIPFCPEPGNDLAEVLHDMLIEHHPELADVSDADAHMTQANGSVSEELSLRGLLRAAAEEECKRFQEAPLVTVPGKSFATSVIPMLNASFLSCCYMPEEAEFKFVQLNNSSLRIYRDTPHSFMINDRCLSPVLAYKDLGIEWTQTKTEDLAYYVAKSLFANALSRIDIHNTTPFRPAQWYRDREVTRFERHMLGYMRRQRPTVEGYGKPPQMGANVFWDCSKPWHSTVQMQVHSTASCHHLMGNPPCIKGCNIMQLSNMQEMNAESVSWVFIRIF